MKAQPLDGASAQASRGIALRGISSFDQHTIHLHISRCHLKARRKPVQKALDNSVAVHANHAAVRPSHADVRNVSSALRQDAFVGGSYVRMWAHNSGDA